jgi:NAD(P)-dependent dehydrogenase (short-subunit alcohol dehydrogenase family)
VPTIRSEPTLAAKMRWCGHSRQSIKPLDAWEAWSTTRCSPANLPTGGSGGWLPFAASKAAIETISRGLAADLAPEGIRVNVVRVGVVDTETRRSQGSGYVGQLIAEVPMPHQRLRETITPRASQNQTLASRKHLAYLQLADSADAGPPAGRRGHHRQPTPRP